MTTFRSTAAIVGALFITATATAIAGLGILGSTLDGREYLAGIASEENRVVVAVIFELALAVSVFAIGAMMYPVLRNVIRSLALGYAVIRLMESVFIVIASISLLSILTLGQDHVASAADASLYQPSADLLLALRDWSFVFGTLIFLGLGGLPLYYSLFRSGLVPRWLAGWGLLGATMILLTGILALFGLDVDSSTTTALAAPIAFQEIVFAVWLIVKGFDRSALSDLQAA